ncbi:hd phosphohydrolase domain-containing protein [Stylonychia lemnae]|uniref:Hd phosphohydrolase domain-containing protein n=1 Tax=Stylonychia lemnae TaxID=5949 RepID=A0A077ZRE2_STYLE|nr:hd phosphohydrolase domain-containing protein [Stylonychia lemnae]|eukprot:CDW72019.1 hd phosphohydrolase domain-containing protein [Stylonychia lemnae]
MDDSDYSSLGPVYQVFSGAVHTRFEHSLGVGYMVQTMMEHFKQIQQSELLIDDIDKQNVVIAGLCNDLGQGIYSHFFDRLLIPTLDPKLKWDYKDASIMMLDSLIDKNNIDLDDKDLKQIKELIRGQYDSSKSCINPSKAWLFDLQRYNMFKQVYCHKVCQAVSLMFLDALVNVNPHYQFIQNLTNPDAYFNFTDPIIKYIASNKSKPEFQISQQILQRISKRDLYKFVGEKLMDTQDYMKISDKINIQDLINCQDPSDGNFLKQDDVSLYQFGINYGYGIQNPVDLVQFYERSTTINEGTGILSETYQNNRLSLMPNQFSESYIRLFVKQEKNLKTAQDAFKKYFEKHIGI